MPKVYNRATGKHQEAASSDHLKGFDVVRDIVRKITGGGLETDKRTAEHVAKMKAKQDKMAKIKRRA